VSNAAVAGRRRVGRFELLRLLGRGAQASVWLANDPRLEREVALKLFAQDADAAAVSEWLHEARAVSRLTHPNIVPVFEADAPAAGQPYLVFEYVEGPTLADAMRKEGAKAPRPAVELMLGVLDALATAHRQGIVHRDLKPSNVLVGADGRARVMDFGIAARVSAQADGSIVGTPGYISPEAARGDAPAATMDVFSAGVMLAELLSGRRLLAESHPMRALARVQAEDLKLPTDVAVDEPLRGIVQRALARDAAKRFDSAASLRDALAQWLAAGNAAEGGAASAGHGTLDFLLRRMRHKSDFPALGNAVVRIQRAATSETESLSSLTAEVLNDVALTQKLLRMVNSASFRHAGGGSISTVSRAVALVGFGGVRNLALSLVLLEHMQNKQHAANLKEEFLRALMAGTLAGALAPLARESEEVFIGAMFQNLGRLLTEFYFPEEAQQIRQQRDELGAEEAVTRVLGIGYEELGVGVARSWGLPDALQRCMRTPAGEVPARPVERGTERQRWLARCANELTDTLLHAPDGVGALAQAHARALGLEAKDVVAATETAKVRLADFARTMGIDVTRQSAARRLLPAGDTLSPGAGGAETPTQVFAPASNATASPAPASPAGGTAVADLLSAGLADLTQTMASSDFRLNDVLRMVLETMYRGLGAQRLVLCLRDPRNPALVGRLSFGSGADVASRAFRIELKPAAGTVPDLFTAVCLKGADTLIKDCSRGGIGDKLPDWYRKTIAAPSFLLLPLMLRGAPFGLIYADAAAPGGIDIGDKELTLLRTLRNQAVMAFRQAEKG